MNIQQSTELIIFVTHVEAENSFLKIWGQVDKNSGTCVERMILPLAEKFARSQDCVGSRANNLHLNALCCARFQNEGYYRAKVINIRPDGMVVLQFIDYGNIEVLPPQEIHLLESIPGAESLQSYPPVAFDFTLANVLPINEIWENKIIELIKKSLCYNEYKILIHSVINNHRFIKLWYNNEDFSELLINRHMALGTTVPEMFRPLTCMREPQVPPVYQQSGNHLISNNCASMGSVQNVNPLHCDGNNMRGYQRSVPVCCSAQQKHMMQSSVQEALVFKSRVLDVPSKHNIHVSFVEDGPHKFSVQLESTSQVLSSLMRDINNHPIEPLQEPPLPGSVCLGRYTQEKVLCRAVVMSVMENKCKLYYVDFGHTEVLPYTDIFQLPSHFINPKVLSIRFTLSGVHELNVNDEMKEYFKQIVTRKLLVLHVCQPEGPPLVQYGDLYDDGKNIKNILRQAFPTPTVSPISFGYQEPTKLLKGAEEIVHVSFVESCRKFFVQLDSSAGSLESVMNCLTEFCQTAPTLSLTQLKIGLPCAALYDNQWYRAQILGVNAANVKILYVDYGNEETVNASYLRFIHDDLIKRLEAQAIKCILHGSELFASTQEISTKFESLTLEKRLLLRVVDTKPDGLIVDLYEPERMESIKTQMLHTGGDERKSVNEPSYQNVEKQRSPNISPNINQSENINNWQKKNQIDTWNEAPNTNVIQEKHKSKSWKDKSNEENLYENRNEKSTFHRNDSRNERSNNKDDFSNARNVKDKWNNRNEYNDSLKSSRGGSRSDRGGRNKTSGYGSKSHSADKSWSDKDSDTSSRGSGRRGRGGSTRGGYSKRDGFSGKTQRVRFSDDDSTKSGDSYHGNNKSKDRKGQGYRLTQYKSAAANNMEEERRRSPTRNKNEFRIPAPNVVIGSTKNCEVVFTNGPSDFYIQFSPDYTALDSMMDSIASIYENGGELVRESKIFNGLYCIAQYSEDSRWYRATVKSIEKDNATVQFLDYGNTETVVFDKIKVIQKEFLKLPIQAVHCKLFGLEGATLDETAASTFEDKVDGKLFEAEFVTEENDIYGVMIREVVDGQRTNAFVNEEFCKGVNLLQAKEATLFSFKPNKNVKQPARPDYASPDAVWSTVSHKPETKKDVIVTWFTNSNNFYCQVLDNENEFKTIMNKIQRVYVGREPVSYTLKIGSPVIATFSEDKALYRAEIVELNKCNGHLIHYVDFGNNAVVDFRNIYPVEKEFMHLPKQSFQCSLLNIIPKDGLSWSNVDTKAVDNCFNGDKYTCTFHGVEDNKYLVSLNNNGKDVADMLVEKNLAAFASKAKSDDVADDSKTIAPTIQNEIERVDINLLSGQALRVKVSSVENVSKFHVQLPFAAECENLINTYMNNTKVMQRLSAHEICLGTGCLVCSNGIWRRAVICNRSQSAGLDVKFIDTGAYDEILSDCVLALPGELSVMQNQAVECSLTNATCSPEADATFKKSVEGNEVIMYIDQVDNNRLIVKLFNTSGKMIHNPENTDEEISPICPMPILSSTHKVLVSYADHSASIWLQRNAELALDRNLSEALAQYYPANGKLVKPAVDLLCAAKGADGLWYRGRVITYTETKACVNFIDYGNNEEVAHDVIMTLDPCFYVPHQLSINVSLPITLGGTASEQVNILQEYLSNKEFTAVFRNVNKKWTVELLYDGEKISEKLGALNLPSQQEVSKAIDVHSMEVGRTYDVSVSHVDSPSQFWLQSTEDASNLSKKQLELQAEAPTFPEVQGILEEGSLCVAMYTITNQWYRAEVIDADEEITTVRFIDYGNADVIDNKSGKLRQIPDSWKEIKEHVVKCRLDVIATDSEDWSTTASQRFESLISPVESLQALVIANGVPKRVDLLVNGQSVSDTLVKEDLAVRIHAEEDLIDEIVDLELDPHSAFVSHINSPSEFWVQEEKSVGDLEVMTDRFIMANMFPKVETIEENMLCVAKYPADDYWYRARVMSHSDDATQVLYIDYGNSAVSTEIRAIPEDLMNVPPLSRKCRLAMPEGVTEWSEQACEEFVKLAAYGATIFLLDVLNDDHDENETSLVKLTLVDENVTDLLAKFCQHCPPIIEERLPPLGEENSPNVFISRINSLDEFYVQNESCTAELNAILDKLETAQDFLPLDTIEDGTVCAAIFPDDGAWYRARILSHSGDSVTVFFIDYGNTAVTNEVRMLPADIMNIPAFSRCCALQKPENMTSWPSEAQKTFVELYSDGETMFQSEILDDSCDPISVKLTLNGKNVIDTLVSPSKETSSCDEVATVEETVDQTLHTSEGQIEEEKQDNLPSSLSVELTVDEIVQNMERNITDGTEEETGTFNTEPLEEKDVEATTKLYDNLAIQDQSQSHSRDEKTSEMDADLGEVNQSEDVQAVEVVEEPQSSVTPIAMDTTVLKDDGDVNDFQGETHVAGDIVRDVQEGKHIADSEAVTDSQEKKHTAEDTVQDLQEEKDIAESEAVTDLQEKKDTAEGTVQDLQKETHIVDSDAVVDSQEKKDAAEGNVQDLQEEKHIVVNDVVTDSQEKKDTAVHDLQEEKHIVVNDVVTDSQEKKDTAVHDLQEEKHITDVVVDSLEKGDIVHDLQEEKHTAESDTVADSQEKSDLADVHDLQEEEHITESDVVEENSQENRDTAENNVRGLQEEKHIAESGVTDPKEKGDIAEDIVHDLHEEKHTTESEAVTNYEYCNKLLKDMQEMSFTAHSKEATDTKAEVNTDKSKDKKEIKENTGTECKVIDEEDKKSCTKAAVEDVVESKAIPKTSE
ncbi:protein tudor-like isoform X2 [Lasioglossum baleicum]|uniref:protein tudor-like isoform X2 n=1 Tax=Lasioglossum baleicum TaxID=434251 RepID=UPI003FCC31FE